MRGRTRPLRLMSASETLAAVPSARTPRVGQAKGMHASFKDFSKKCYTAAHADTHRMVGEALRKGVRHEEHENFRSVAGIYNSLGRCASALYTRPRPRQPEAWAGLHCCCAACLRSLGRKRAHHGLGFPELRARGPCLHPGSLGPSVALSTWLALLPLTPVLVRWPVLTAVALSCVLTCLPPSRPLQLAQATVANTRRYGRCDILRQRMRCPSRK